MLFPMPSPKRSLSNGCGRSVMGLILAMGQNQVGVRRLGCQGNEFLPRLVAFVARLNRPPDAHARCTRPTECVSPRERASPRRPVAAGGTNHPISVAPWVMADGVPQWPSRGRSRHENDHARGRCPGERSAQSEKHGDRPVEALQVSVAEATNAASHPAAADRADLVNDNPRRSVQCKLRRWPDGQTGDRLASVPCRQRADCYAVELIERVRLNDDRRTRLADKIASAVRYRNDVTAPHRRRTHSLVRPIA